MTGLSSGKLRIKSATSRIRSADATDDPPNFITQVSCCPSLPSSSSGASSFKTDSLACTRTLSVLGHGQSAEIAEAKSLRGKAAESKILRVFTERETGGEREDLVLRLNCWHGVLAVREIGIFAEAAPMKYTSCMESTNDV